MSKRNFMWEVEQLKKYALDNYEEGGHWIAETYSDLDYGESVFLSTSLQACKKEFKEYWEMMNQRERECSWGE